MYLNENNYITYLPRFDIRRALSFKVEETGEEYEPSYEVPSELADAASILASDLLARADALLDQIGETLDNLKSCLGNTQYNGVSADDYDRAVEEDDYAMARVFEDYHSADINGSTQGELYCMLRSLQGRIEHVRQFTAQNIVPVTSEFPQELYVLEEKMYTDLAYMEYKKPGSVDRLALAYEAQLKHQVKKRLETFESVLDRCIGIAKISTNDSCNGSVESVAGEMAVADAEVLNGIGTVLKTSFGNLARQELNLNEQDRLYGNQQIIEDLHDTAVSLARLRLNAVRKVAAWLKELALDSDKSPAYNLVDHSLTGLTVIDSGLDTTILDLAKAQNMEKMNLEARLTNITARKQIRQLVGLVDSIAAAIDFTAPPQERRRQGEMIGRFIASQDKGLCN